MVMWDEIAAEVAQDFPDVTRDKMLVDAMTVRMVEDPKSLGTVGGKSPGRGGRNTEFPLSLALATQNRTRRRSIVGNGN